MKIEPYQRQKDGFTEIGYSIFLSEKERRQIMPCKGKGKGMMKGGKGKGGNGKGKGK